MLTDTGDFYRLPTIGRITQCKSHLVAVYILHGGQHPIAVVAVITARLVRIDHLCQLAIIITKCDRIFRASFTGIPHKVQCMELAVLICKIIHSAGTVCDLGYFAGCICSVFHGNGAFGLLIVLKGREPAACVEVPAVALIIRNAVFAVAAAGICQRQLQTVLICVCGILCVPIEIVVGAVFIFPDVVITV